MNHHLGALEFVELFTDGSLLLRREASPWSVGSPIVILSIGYFDIIVKPYDLVGISIQLLKKIPAYGSTCKVFYFSCFQFFNCGSETQLAEQRHLFFFTLFLLLGWTCSYKKLTLNLGIHILFKKKSYV